MRKGLYILVALLIAGALVKTGLKGMPKAAQKPSGEIVLKQGGPEISKIRAEGPDPEITATGGVALREKKSTSQPLRATGNAEAEVKETGGINLQSKPVEVRETRPPGTGPARAAGPTETGTMVLKEPERKPETPATIGAAPTPPPPPPAPKETGGIGLRKVEEPETVKHSLVPSATPTPVPAPKETGGVTLALPAPQESKAEEPAAPERVAAIPPSPKETGGVALSKPAAEKIEGTTPSPAATPTPKPEVRETGQIPLKTR